jgi:hypothetical protein
MDSALLYLPYLPNAFWFHNFLRHETIFIEREEKFVKSSFRNRAVIAGPQGILILSIPIIGGRDHSQFYKEVKISYHYNWGKKHWQSIRSAYGSAPFFEHYENAFETLFEKQFESLFDFNSEMLLLLLHLFKINKAFDFTSIYEKTTSDIVDLRSVKSPAERIDMPRYYQVFEERNGFIANLSIIDLLFHLGPQAKDYLLYLK